MRSLFTALAILFAQACVLSPVLTPLPAFADNSGNAAPAFGTTPTQPVQFGASTVSQIAKAANSYRGYVWVQNQSSGSSTLTVSFGGASTVGIQLLTGQIFAAPIKSAVYLQSSAGVINALVLEGIY